MNRIYNIHNKPHIIIIHLIGHFRSKHDFRSELEEMSDDDVRKSSEQPPQLIQYSSIIFDSTLFRNGITFSVAFAIIIVIIHYFLSTHIAIKNVTY